jgi:LPS-assembly lipoprotein
MSSPEPNRARRLLAIGAVVTLAAGLAGCIRPLYGSAGVTGGSVGTELAAIHVEPVNDYLGHELRNELDFLLTGGKPVLPAKYRLVVVPVSTRQGAVVDTLYGRSESATMAITAQYKLYSAADSKEVSSGRAIISVSYDRTQERFANVRAERDAMGRGAKTLADQIRTQLAIYFATRK